MQREEARERESGATEGSSERAGSTTEGTFVTNSMLACADSAQAKENQLREEEELYKYRVLPIALLTLMLGQTY